MHTPGRGTSLNTDSIHLNHTFRWSEEVKQAARMAICDRAADAREATELMRMLAIHPDDDKVDKTPHTPPRRTK